MVLVVGRRIECRYVVGKRKRLERSSLSSINDHLQSDQATKRPSDDVRWRMNEVEVES